MWLSAVRANSKLCHCLNRGKFSISFAIRKYFPHFPWFTHAREKHIRSVGGFRLGNYREVAKWREEIVEKLGKTSKRLFLDSIVCRSFLNCIEASDHATLLPINKGNRKHAILIFRSDFHGGKSGKTAITIDFLLPTDVHEFRQHPHLSPPTCLHLKTWSSTK